MLMSNNLDKMWVLKDIQFNGIVNFSRNGRLLLISGHHNSHVVNLDYESDFKMVKSISKFDQKQAIEISPDGNVLAMGCLAETDAEARKYGVFWVGIVDAVNGSEVRRLTQDKGLTHKIYGILTIAFSESGLFLAAGGYHAAVFEVLTGRCLMAHKVGHDSVYSRVCFADSDRILIEADNGSSRDELFISLYSGASYDTLICTRSCKLFASHPRRNGVALADGGVIKLLNPFNGVERQLWESGYSVDEIAFSPNGEMLAFVIRGSTIKILDSATGKLRQSLTCNCVGNRIKLHFSPDSKKVLFASNVGLILFNLADERSMEIDRASDSACFSPDGKVIVNLTGTELTSWCTGPMI